MCGVRGGKAPAGSGGAGSGKVTLGPGGVEPALAMLGEFRMASWLWLVNDVLMNGECNVNIGWLVGLW